MSALDASEEPQPVPSPIRVFLVDDHEVVRRGIAKVLEREPDIAVVGEASTVAEARLRIPASRPDVALLDARLSDGSGIDLCGELRPALPSVRCLILTSYEDDDALFKAVMAGAHGYLLKSVRGTNLTDAVRHVAAGQSLLDPAMTNSLLRRVRGDDHDPRLKSLTDRERAILALITDGRSNREIANQLHLAEKTVKNQITTLLRKLGLESRTQAALLGAEAMRSSELGEH